MPQMKEISKKNKLNKLELSRFMFPLTQILCLHIII